MLHYELITIHFLQDLYQHGKNHSLQVLIDFQSSPQFIKILNNIIHQINHEPIVLFIPLEVTYKLLYEDKSWWESKSEIPLSVFLYNIEILKESIVKVLHYKLTSTFNILEWKEVH